MQIMKLLFWRVGSLFKRVTGFYSTVFSNIKLNWETDSIEEASELDKKNIKTHAVWFPSRIPTFSLILFPFLPWCVCVQY